MAFSPDLASTLSQASSDGMVGVYATPRMAKMAMTDTFQTTLASSVTCKGIALHSGEMVTMRLVPAEAGTGIRFLRTDLKNGAREVQALWSNVVDTRMCTVVANNHGGKVATIEHLMAALYASGIDNAWIEIDGAEIPVMDGSSAPFMDMIDQAGVQTLSSPRRWLVINQPIEVRDGDKFARLAPADTPRYSCEIVFDRAVIGTQQFGMTLTPNNFREAISPARTFGFYEDVEMMRQHGLARGGSLDNAVVIKGETILNTDGLRFHDEFVRHKILDAIGDLALAGAPIRGAFNGFCTGHALNNQLLRALFAQKDAWTLSTH